MPARKVTKLDSERTPAKSIFGTDDDDDESDNKSTMSDAKSMVGQKRSSALASIMEENERMRAKRAVQDVVPNWLHDGIVVKVMNKSFAGGKYYGQKGLLIHFRTPVD